MLGPIKYGNKASDKKAKNVTRLCNSFASYYNCSTKDAKIAKSLQQV